MVMVVLDSTNTEAVLADARGEEAAALPVNDNASTKAQGEVKPEPVVAAGEEDDKEVDFATELGITKEQQGKFEKILKYEVGKKVRRIKEAEEFAADQIFERRAVEQRAGDLERENERLKTQLSPPAVVAEAIAPKREDFQTEEAYSDAVMDWKVDQRFKAREADAAKSAQEARQAQVLADASARIARAIEVVPDFVAVTEAVDLVVPAVVAGAMQESELFAELGYHFAKHPEELEAIRQMSPAKSLVALGKIEAKLQPFAPVAKVESKVNGDKPSAPNGTQPSPKTDVVPSRPRASAPITPLSQASSVQVVKDETDMSVREVITDWSRKNKVNLERRKRH